MYSAEVERSREICLPLLLTTDSIVSGLVGVGGESGSVTSSLHFQTAPGHMVVDKGFYLLSVVKPME